ncbi:hypothetical protein JCM24511_02681 [Saitozyma sp. JCM 24511]|nr:hypothetical protein JCM24511_02681 [Saitozyma sp. JCM 24511]
MFPLVAIALLAGVVRAQDALLTLIDSEATVYYDLTNSLCGDNDPFPNDWAETSGINNGVPFCQGQTDKTLEELGTNRIVAVNATMMQGDPSGWCGKEVQLVDSSGNQFSFSEGSLFIWDACAAAVSSHIVDLSAKAFTELKGGTCSGNNPTGLTINILNSNVWDANSGGSSASASTSSGSGTPSTSSAAPSVSSASSSRAGSSGPSRASFSTYAQSSQTSQTSQTQSGSTIGAKLAAVQPSSATLTASASSAVVSAATGSGDSSSSGSSGLPASASTVTSGAVPISSAGSGSGSDLSSGSGGCTFGEWQCNGLQLQVCNSQLGE